MKGYGKEVDMWSVGVIVYILLCGFPPFYADNDAQLFQQIKAGKYEFLRPYWDPVSPMAKEFVAKLLVVDPKRRLTADQALQHPWLAGEAGESSENLSYVTENLKDRQARSKLKVSLGDAPCAPPLAHVQSPLRMPSHPRTPMHAARLLPHAQGIINVTRAMHRFQGAVEGSDTGSPH